jgi:hypothetical protein
MAGVYFTLAMMASASADDLTRLRPEWPPMACRRASPETPMHSETKKAPWYVDMMDGPGGLARDRRRVYSAPERLGLNRWALAGEWTIGRQASVLTREPIPKSHRPWWDGDAYCAGQGVLSGVGASADRRRERPGLRPEQFGQLGRADKADSAEATGVR